MAIVSGLKKIFTRKRRFAPPNEYKLNYRERESLIALFGILACVIIIAAIVYMI